MNNFLNLYVTFSSQSNWNLTDTLWALLSCNGYVVYFFFYFDTSFLAIHLAIMLLPICNIYLNLQLTRWMFEFPNNSKVTLFQVICFKLFLFQNNLDSVCLTEDLLLQTFWQICLYDNTCFQYCNFRWPTDDLNWLMIKFSLTHTTASHIAVF